MLMVYHIQMCHMCLYMCVCVHAQWYCARGCITVAAPANPSLQQAKVLVSM